MTAHVSFTTRCAGIPRCARIAFFAAATWISGCRVGPNYKTPSAPISPAFKEQPPVGWKQSQPGDSIPKGKWWQVYNDPALNALEEQVSISNQNVAQAEAQYRAARAVVREARAALFPTVSTGPSITESRSGSTGGNLASGIPGISGGSPQSRRTFFDLPFNVTWEPDLWGNLRRAVTAGVANAQSFAALIENAKLLFQAELAQDYFGLHGSDSQMNLLTRTQASYHEFLTLTQNRFAAGVASDLDVAQAESQLYLAQSELIDLTLQRAQFEHAIAVLTGKAPADVSLPPGVLTILPPAVPIGLPSELLERRPDISSTERQVAAANEQIGIAMAAFYPTVTLSATGGFESSSISSLLNWSSRFWSVGPQLSQTLFDAGRRRAVVVQQQAVYDATVAGYRQTVLTAMQQVEDNLAALRILEQEANKVQQTVGAADRALAVSTAQYRAGTTSFLTVITSQAALLNAQQTAIVLLTRRLTASVGLIQALGGGWSTADLPTRQGVTAKMK